MKQVVIINSFQYHLPKIADIKWVLHRLILVVEIIITVSNSGYGNQVNPIYIDDILPTLLTKDKFNGKY